MNKIYASFSKTFGKSRPSLPLKEAGKIVCGNATRLYWETVCPKSPNSEVYILGNPPYLGSKLQSVKQKSDLAHVCSKLDSFKILDYIAPWFIKGANYIRSSNAKLAFVSTSSICQGEQVGILWPYILSLDLDISFAHLPFKWTNSARENAGVTCSIIGVSQVGTKNKLLYGANRVTTVANINPYLINAKNYIVSKRNLPLSDLPKMVFGCMPYDEGNLLLSREEKEELINSFPHAKYIIKNLFGFREFLQGVQRWCLWIKVH